MGDDDKDRTDVATGPQAPAATVKKTAPDAPENLGHEGKSSPLKRNTTGAGGRQDRGP